METDNFEFILKGVKNRLNILNKQVIMQKKSQTKIPTANRLIQESQNNEDLDDNGLIYGYDFIIEENENIPMILNIYQQNLLNKDELIKKDWKKFINKGD